MKKRLHVGSFVFSSWIFLFRRRPTSTIFSIFEKHYRNNEWSYDNGRHTKMKVMVETFHLW